jgi:hypothetical protein
MNRLMHRCLLLLIVAVVGVGVLRPLTRASADGPHAAPAAPAPAPDPLAIENVKFATELAAQAQEHDAERQGGHCGGPACSEHGGHQFGQ